MLCLGTFDINNGSATLGRNFYVSIWVGGGLRDRRAESTTTAFVLGPMKTTENLYRVGRSRDIPDVY